MVQPLRGSLLLVRCVLLHGTLLAAVDQRLTPAAAAAGEGALGDGSLTAAELEAALRALPRGKAPGLDGIPYEFYLRFWGVLGGELAAVLQEAFSSADSPALPAGMLQGRITLLYKGKGLTCLALQLSPHHPAYTDYKLAVVAAGWVASHGGCGCHTDSLSP